MYVYIYIYAAEKQPVSKCWVVLWGDPENTTLRNATFNWEGGSHIFRCVAG